MPTPPPPPSHAGMGGGTPFYGLYRYTRFWSLIEHRFRTFLSEIEYVYLHSGLELTTFFRRSYFFIIIDTTINKSLHKLCLEQLRQLQRL